MVQERTQELQNERQRLDDILYATNVGTWEWDLRTGETTFNERWANIIGYSLCELEPVSIKTWNAFAHPDDLAVSKGLLEKHFKREIDYYEFECRMKHKEGHWIWVLDRGKVVTWTEDSEPLTMSGTHQDITHRKQIEAALRKSELELQQIQKAESLGRMAGAIAHHFNNQLNVVSGNLELALDDLSGDIEIRDFLIDALEATHRSMEISGLMLTYLGMTMSKREPLDLSEVCRRNLPHLKNALPKSLAFEADVMPAGPIVIANTNQVLQVLMHLITNSAEASAFRIFLPQVKKDDVPPLC